MSNTPLAAGTLLLALTVMGCDPCSGLGACGGPLFRFDGEVLKAYPVGAADGIRVEFVRTGGVAIKEEVIVSESDRDGRFRIEGHAQADGEVVGDLTFFPPEGVPPVRVAGVRFQTTRAAGEVRYSGKWSVPYPHLPYEAQFYARGTLHPAVGVEVEFRRTGGIPVFPDTFRVTTNSFGGVKLRPLARTLGEVTAELMVYPLPPFRPYLIPNLRMSTFLTQRIDSTLVTASVGPYLPYAGVLVWEDTGEPARGFDLEFRRTSGAPIHPDPFVTVPDSFGTFHVNPVPLSTGVVEGKLFIRSPAEYEGYFLRDLHMPVYELHVMIQNMGRFRVPRVAP